MASALSAVRRARDGHIDGLTDATVTPEQSRAIADAARLVAALIDSARHWVVTVMAASPEARAVPIPYTAQHPCGHEPSGSVMDLLRLFMASLAIGDRAGHDGHFELWRGHCADRMLRMTATTKAHALLEGYAKGVRDEIERTIEGVCRVEKTAGVLLDSAERGLALEMYCFMASLKPGFVYGDATCVRLTQLGMALDWVRRINPSDMKDETEETRARLGIPDVAAWMNKMRKGDELVSAYLTGGDVRGYFVTGLGHFAQRRVAIVTNNDLRFFRHNDPTGLYQSDETQLNWLNATLKENKRSPESDADWARMSPFRRELWLLRAYAVSASEFAAAKNRVSAQDHGRSTVPWLADHLVQDMCGVWDRLSRKCDMYEQIPPFIVAIGQEFLVTDTKKSVRTRTAAEAIAAFCFLAVTDHGGERKPGVPVHTPWVADH